MQDQRLVEIPLRPGIVKELSTSEAREYWMDADKIRFRFGKPELIGGWQNVTTPTATAELLGTPRALETVRAIDGTRAAVIGTNSGLFSSNLSNFYNITPITSISSHNNILSTSVGSTLVLVSLSAHGLDPDTLVAFTSAATTIGGNILINVSAQVTATFQVNVIDEHSFTFNTGVTAAATSAGTGGTFTLFRYYGADNASSQIDVGWGTSVWSGDFGWGTPTSTAGGTIFINPLRLWSLDLWGTEIMAVPTSGPLMRWQPILGYDTHATIVTAAPSINQIVRVAPEARHLVLYGTHDISGDYDPLLIRWCSSEDFTDWAPTLNNTAGDYRLPSRGSEIRNVTRMSDKAIILTDFDLFSQNYIGSNDVFGFIRGSENCGVISQNAAIEYNGVLYWMSNNGQFFKFDGRVQSLACTVLRYVFSDLNYNQYRKICGGVNSRFDEVIWFYPSSASDENDRYVIYHTVEGHWTIGTLARTAWKDSSAFDNPLATGGLNKGLYYHEVGYADETIPLQAFLESGYFSVEDGNPILFSNKVVPDFTNVSDNDPFTGLVELTLRARKYPSSDVISKGPYLITTGTEKISTRLRGREFSIRITSDRINAPWRLGRFRMSINGDGLR